MAAFRFKPRRPSLRAVQARGRFKGILMAHGALVLAGPLWANHAAFERLLVQLTDYARRFGGMTRAQMMDLRARAISLSQTTPLSKEQCLRDLYHQEWGGIEEGKRPK
jgi:hypothetical protein